MSDNVQSDLVTTETPDVIPVYVLEDVETAPEAPSTPSQHTAVKTFATQAAAGLVVAIVAPIMSAALQQKVEQRRARREEKKARKAAEKSAKAAEETEGSSTETPDPES